MALIDLHTHSTYSDGTFTPAELIDYALAHDIHVLSLTDHDSISGVEQALAYAADHPITIVPGVELSVLWRNQVLHVVGLAVNIKDNGLIGLLKEQQSKRLQRAVAIAEQFQQLGFDDMLTKAQAHAGQDGLITRPHFAKVLVEEGVCKDMKSAFKKFLKRGRPAYVQTDWVSLADGINVLNEAGAIATLAHPLRYKFTQTKLNELLVDFKDAGGQAMEVVAGMTSQQEISTLKSLCKKYDLLASVGSDFHGEKITPHAMKQLTSLPKDCPSVLAQLGIIK